MENIIDALQARGFIEATTSPDLASVAKAPMKVYCGFDPTADSLHLGNLVPIMGLAWFQKFGHTPVAIVGGATGMIGDPSGRSKERIALNEDIIQKNLEGIKKNLLTVLENSSPGKSTLLLLNNYDWMKDFPFLHFLRDVGKHFRVGSMIAKESVKLRLASEEGMSFTEFCYQLLQGYDFLHLFQNYGVCLEMGGSDQWGNIIAGIELIRKVLGKPAYGLTFPLLVRSDGQKFGKSEKGAIWLSADKLSPYEFYQYLVKVPDADVIKLMRLLTFMDLAEIHFWENKMRHNDYEPNSAQKKLAEEITKLIHGEDNVLKAVLASQHAAPGHAGSLDRQAIEVLANEIPKAELKYEMVVGKKLVDVIVEAKFQSSKGEARRLIANGGLWLNNQRIQDESYILQDTDCIEGCYLLFALGKKNKALIEIQG